MNNKILMIVIAIAFLAIVYFFIRSSEKKKVAEKSLEMQRESQLSESYKTPVLSTETNSIFSGVTSAIKNILSKKKDDSLEYKKGDEFQLGEYSPIKESTEDYIISNMLTQPPILPDDYVNYNE